MTQVNINTERGQQVVERILKVIGEGELSSREITTRAAVCHQYGCSFLKAMAAAGMIHIGGWGKAPTNNYPIELWKVGGGSNAPRPKKKPMHLRSKAYRDNARKNDPEKYMYLLNKMKAWRLKAKVKRDVAASWIEGVGE